MPTGMQQNKPNLSKETNSSNIWNALGVHGLTHGAIKHEPKHTQAQY
jgi:hypothetical protein